AAIHFGHTLAVKPVAELDVKDIVSRGPRVVLGSASITGTCTAVGSAHLLDLRRTSRIPYHNRVVEASVIDALTRVAARGGHRFIAPDDLTTVAPVLRLNAEAIVDNLQLEDEREEIRGWYRLGQTPTYGDGLWQQPLNQSAWEVSAAFAVPYLFGW